MSDSYSPLRRSMGARAHADRMFRKILGSLDAIKWLEVVHTHVIACSVVFKPMHDDKCMMWTWNRFRLNTFYFLFFSPSSDKQIDLYKDWRKHREEEHARERKSDCYLFPQEWSGRTREGAQTLPSRISLFINKYICLHTWCQIKPKSG